MDYYSDQLLSTLGSWMCFFIIHGGILLLSLIILINKLWKRRTVIGAEEESTAAAPPTDLVSSADHTSSSSTNGRSYEVFLSFRGLDTRTNFTDHLYTALVDAGIHTFRDDNEIRMGEEISSELLTAIQQSRISIPVFSTNYADSKWCLIELTKMVVCRQKLNQIVLPIFYNVEPSDVRYQRGTYAKAFSKHLNQKRVDKKTVEEWREALKVAGSLKGHNVKNRHEAELIKIVVEMILSQRENTPLVTGDYLVGIGYHVKEMLKLLDVSSARGVRIVGIHGMGGIGKTTIAKAIYNEISCHFESCSFIEDVRETTQQHKGRVEVQKQLISNILRRKDVAIMSVDEGVNMIKERCCNKKVLIVLDDIDNLNQLRALANKRDWFGLGSRIIITTRDKHILTKHEVDEVYEPGGLDNYQSLQLFSMHAFGRDRPPNDYYGLSSAIAQTAGGLPLALEVLGCHLSDSQPKAVWEDALKKLKKIPHDEVQTKLRVSYNALEYEQKQIFLDIACIFNGMNKRIVTYIWDDCEYFPQEGIDILIRRSLVKIGDSDRLWMHSQLQDLGREIVRAENFKEPGKRTRLWFHDVAWEVLKTRTGTAEVEGLCLDFRNGPEENYLTNEEFAGMSTLRLLQIDYAIISGDFKHLLSKLRWLSWKGCPYNFTATNFYPEKLIVLNLSRSRVTEDWEGWNQIKMAKKLKVINLSGCNDLIKTPDFSAFQSLEGLILEDCRSLVEIDASIGYLKCLVFLNVKDCQSLVDLPVGICGLYSLKSLIVSGCIKLSGLPLRLESVRALRELRMDGTSMGQLSDSMALPKQLEILSARNCRFFTVLPTSIGQLRFLTDVALDEIEVVMLPDSIGSLSKLRKLSLCRCRSLRKIPDSIGQLESLVELNLHGAGVIEIPYSIGHLKSLTNFNLDSTQIIELPDSIGLLVKLEKLSLCNCKSLRKIPDSVGQLESVLYVGMSRTEIMVLPDSIGSLLNLQVLSFSSRCRSLKIPDSFGQMESLVKLNLSGAGITEIPDSIGLLSMLADLSLDDCQSLRRIPDSIGRLESLHRLNLIGLGRLESLPDAIGELKSLAYLRLEDTQIIELPDSIGSLSMLEELSLTDCGSLRRIPDSIGRLESLIELELSCTQIIELPDSIGSLSMLEVLSLTECGSLRRIPDSIGRLESLSSLYLTMSGIIEIPDAIGKLKSLMILDLGCTQIIELPSSIGWLSMLKRLSLEKCRSLRRIPDSIGRLESLLELNLIGTMLTEIPDTLGHLESLTRLQLDGTQIIELPNSIWSLPKLELLSLIHCRLLQKIPDSIEKAKSLYELTLDTTDIMDKPNANAMGNHRNLKDLCIDKSGIDGWDHSMAGGGIPIDIGKLPHSLINLTLWSENSFTLPESISSLRLHFLSIRNCRNHPLLPHLPSTLSFLRISRCAMETLPDFSNLTYLQWLSISDCENLLGNPYSSALFNLKQLHISNCRKLQCFPHLPSGLEKLHLSSCMSVESTPDLSNLKSLYELELTDFVRQTEIKGLERIKLLRSLDLSGCRSIERLPNMKGLGTLILRNCEKFCDIEGLERLKSLKRLDMSGCISLERLPNLSNLKSLEELWISNCKQLIEIRGIDELISLKKLDVSGCISLERLPNLSNLKRLKKLWISNCKQLIEIQGINELKSLERLDVSGCILLERLPNLSNLKKLKKLRISNCKQLIEIQGISELISLKRLDVSGCISLESLPNLSNLKRLEELWISNCKQLIKIQGINKGVHIYGSS